MHPILTTRGYDADIRLCVLQINGLLLASSAIILFVGFDKAKTPLLAPLNGYIGGADEKTIDELCLAGIIPAFVSTLVFGIKLRLGNISPRNAAYQADGNGGFFAFCQISSQGLV